MADWPPVIDADGHVLERQSDIRKYLEPPWNRRNTGLWPSDQPFDTDLFDTLGYPGYGRGMSPAQQVETWLKIMDEYNIEQAVLFPTGSGNIPKLREPEFCVAACRAANDHFAKEYNALSDRIHCVGVLPLKWPDEAAKELRRAVTELGLVSFELLSMGLPTALGDPMYDPLYEEAQRLDVPLSVHGNRSSSAEVGAGALRTFAEVHTYTFPVGIFLHFTSIIFQGVPVRFPKLRLAFLEIGASWLPVLARPHGRALGIARRVRGAASKEKTQRGGARVRGLLQSRVRGATPAPDHRVRRRRPLSLRFRRSPLGRRVSQEPQVPVGSSRSFTDDQGEDRLPQRQGVFPTRSCRLAARCPESELR